MRYAPLILSIAFAASACIHLASKHEEPPTYVLSVVLPSDRIQIEKDIPVDLQLSYSGTHATSLCRGSWGYTFTRGEEVLKVDSVIDPFVKFALRPGNTQRWSWPIRIKSTGLAEHPGLATVAFHVDLYKSNCVGPKTATVRSVETPVMLTSIEP